MTVHVKFHICTLIASFCWKYIKFQLKKYRGVMHHDTEKWCNIWRKTDLLFQKWQEFWEFWSKHSKVSKICTLIGPFRAKYITFDLKKYRWVIFHDTEESCKIWRKTGLWFGNDMRTLAQIFIITLGSVKIGLWLDPFAQSRKCMSEKFTEELCVITLKNNEKSEEELTCRFIRNLMNFDFSTRKSQKFTL